MSTEKDSMLRVRLTQRIDAIIDELQAQMPEAVNATLKCTIYRQKNRPP